MLKAGQEHKARIIDLLTDCFNTNKSVNWIVKQDEKRTERIRDLMDYSFDTCIKTEQIYITEDQQGVLICSLSDDKLPFLTEAWLTARFVLKVTGIEGIGKALRRENYVNSFHPHDHEFIYIWFIAVDKSAQGKGLGSQMLGEIIDKANKEGLPIYLETSNKSNLHFYEKNGFEIYHISSQDVFGFKLYFLRKGPEKLQEGF